MTWGRWKVPSCWPVWMLLIVVTTSGCSLFRSTIEPFTCSVTPSYHQDGTADTDSYTVKKACLRGIQQRLDACYKE